MKERWQSIPALTSRESKGEVIYPPEFWKAQHPQRRWSDRARPDRFVLWIVRHDRALGRIALWAALLLCIFGWGYLIAMGGRF